MEPRGPWTGLAQVVRFNWHLYVAAVAGEVALAVALVMLPHPAIWRVALVAAALPGLLWSAGSLLVSHWVYDRSDLYRWRWLAVMRLAPASWVSIHPGLDESSPAPSS